MLETLHRKKHLTSFQFIILGFAGIIFVGALLLMLPFHLPRGQSHLLTRLCLHPHPLYA